jgi:hypothetical protein
VAVLAEIWRFENRSGKKEKKIEKFDTVTLDTCSLIGSGSGWVAVVPLDRGDQGGSNGTSWSVWLWLWLWQWRLFLYLVNGNFFYSRWLVTKSLSGACGSTSGSGWVAVVPLDRRGQGGSNGVN